MVAGMLRMADALQDGPEVKMPAQPRTGRTASRAGAIAAVTCGMIAAEVPAQEVGRLYAARPPAGSAFVRIATAMDMEETTKFAVNTTQVTIPRNEVASRYVVAPANKTLVIAVAGSSVKSTLTPLPGRFYTIAIAAAGKDWAERAIDEGTGNSNDLKTELRFFNLLSDCKASLRIADGPQVFEAVNPGELKSRTINPVQARLQADCADAVSGFELPQLKPGDHYSLFLRKTGLSGQFDETEPYREQ